ncbi:HAD family hydrolase [Myceligenerans halotolerans]
MNSTRTTTTAPPPSPTDPMLFALDVDGTIVAEGTIDVPPITTDVVQDAVAAGHHVVLSTGRSLVGVLPVAASLGLTSGWIVCSNGAVIARLAANAPGGYEITDTHMLHAAPVVQRARELVPGVQIAAETVGVGYHVTHEFEPGTLNGRQTLVAPEQLPEATPRLVLRAPDIAETLTHQLRELDVTATPASDRWLDLTPAPLSKATALYHVRRRLGVHPDRTLAIGDAVNDLPAFRWAAIAVAMGGASAVVRAAADVTTGTLEQHGAATILEAVLAGGLQKTRL